MCGEPARLYAPEFPFSFEPGRVGFLCGFEHAQVNAALIDRYAGLIFSVTTMETHAQISGGRIVTLGRASSVPGVLAFVTQSEVFFSAVQTVAIPVVYDRIRVFEPQNQAVEQLARRVYGVVISRFICAQAPQSFENPTVFVVDKGKASA
jgi:hypothetical protein